MKYLLIFSLFFLSCSSDKLIVPNSNCIAKTRYNNIIFDEVEYNKSNRCITIKGSGHYPGSVSYDDGKISRIVINYDTGGGKIYDMIYDVKFTGNNAVNIMFNGMTPIQPRLTNAFLFTNNLVSRASYYEIGYDVNGTGPLTMTTLVLYTYDSSNNLVKEEVQFEGKLMQVTEYANYDDKINPRYANAMDWTIISGTWRLRLSHPDMPISKNNPQIIKNTYYNYSGSVLEKTIITTDSIFYKYSQNNLPIEISTSNRDYYPVQIEYKN